MADEGSPDGPSPAAHGDPQLSIAEVQARILEQLQAARAVLTARSGSGSLPKDELAEVLEELSHSTALLATVKRDLDGMFGRLRRTRAALAAAFPQHAVAPRPVVQHGEEAAVRGRQRQQGQPRGGEAGEQTPHQVAEADEQPGPDGQEERQRQQERRPSPTPAEQGAAGAAGTEAPGAPGAVQADQQAPGSEDAEEEQRRPDAPAATQAGQDAPGGGGSLEAADVVSPRAPPSSAAKQDDAADASASS